MHVNNMTVFFAATNDCKVTFTIYTRGINVLYRALVLILRSFLKGYEYITVLLLFQVLISFGCGYCVLYDMKCNNSQAVKDAKVDPHKRFFYDPGHSHVS